MRKTLEFFEERVHRDVLVGRFDPSPIAKNDLCGSVSFVYREVVLRGCVDVRAFVAEGCLSSLNL